MTPHTGQDRLSQLPIELLINILQCTDFTSLWSLINTSSRLSSIFNQHAGEIVSAILNTVPSPTRVLMQAVLSMQKGTFPCNSLREARILGSGHDQYEPLGCVSGTSSQLRCFVRLCHHVHVLAHMTIESCLQRCLKSPLGQREIPAGFEDPTWTEEQRMLLGFWRFVYWNQLKKDTKNNRLRWFRPDLETLEHWRPYDDCPAALGKQAYTALFYIEDIIAPGVFKSEFDALHSESLELPPLLPEKEFGWKCRPASSSLAITQHWRPSEKFRELTAHEISAQMKRLSSTEQDTLSGLTYVSRPRRFYHASSSSLSDYSSQEEEIDELDEENGEGLDLSVETDDSPQTGRQSRSRPSRPVHCTLTYTTTEADTETQHQSVLTRRHPWNPRPVRKFGPRYKTKDESLDLGRPTLGLQFWRSMSLNPEGGPAQFMWFEGYIRYGFALWEEKRMIDLGLWSDGVIEDMTEFYQRWYYFLDAEDISRYKVKASFFLSDDGDNE